MPVDVVLPAVVYHGTLDLYLESFKERLLNRTYWKDGRDFGKGLYTTISIEQAKAWARSAQDKWILVSRTPTSLSDRWRTRTLAKSYRME